MSYVSLLLQAMMLLGVLLMIPVAFAALAEILADAGERNLRRSAAQLPDRTPTAPGSRSRRMGARGTG